MSEIEEARAKLNERQLAFANLVLEGRPATRAYMEVYEQDNYESAAVGAHQCIKSNNVKAYMDACRKDSLEAVGLTLQRLDKALFERIEAVLGVDVTDVQRHGSMEFQDGIKNFVEFLPSEALTDKQRKAIKSVQVGQNAKIEMHDIGELLKLAYQRHGALTQKNKNEVSGSITLTVDPEDMKV